jgi:hypothetical protein
LARKWLSIHVELVEGHGEHLWPRPGRIFAAARAHTFEQLADAIDDAFARWDRSHLQGFTLESGTRVTDLDDEWDLMGGPVEDFQRVKLSRLGPDEHFASTMPRLLPTPVSCAWAQTNSYASTPSSTPVFLFDQMFSVLPKRQ